MIPMRLRRLSVGLTLLLWTASFPLVAHVGNHPSVHDTVAGILNRFAKLDEATLRSMTVADALARLTDEERRILGTEHLTFKVDVPVVVWVLQRDYFGDDPFWLAERGFEKTDATATIGGDTFVVWRKAFDAGEIGLGVNSLSGGGDHYAVVLTPQTEGATVTISDLYPGIHRVEVAKVGARAYVDRGDTIEALPSELEGGVLIQTARGRRNDGQLLNVFRFTEHPATRQPDQIVLTWSDDPRTTQTIQWRTSTEVMRGVVTYQEKRLAETFRPSPPLEVEAERMRLETPETVNDPVVHRFTAVLRDLKPGTTYVYTVGDGTEEGTSAMSEFTTAPDETVPFSFIYMGDAQNGLDRWGTLVHNAFRRRPDAAFYIMAGDIVNRGNDRDDWDELFANAAGVYDRRQLVPAIGNHENQGGHPTLFLKNFTLPTNGPKDVEPERVYALRYSNALFLILDSNLPPESQAAWIEEQLANTDATWKFVVYHHPAYSSTPGRDNRSLRETWVPIFDKYHVDMALQGHDHAYLRTYPMKGNEPVDNPSEGTIYVVSVSGMKMYAQADRDYIAKGFTNTSTYQVLDIQVSGDRLVYRAYDIDGNLKDEVVIEK